MKLAPIFSPNSRRVAYVAQHDRRLFAVIDGAEGKKYDRMSGIIFSPDSRRVAYTAIPGERWFVVVDDVGGKEYDGIHDSIFSPDSKRVAYVARRDGKWFVVVDGMEGKEFPGLLRGNNIVFDNPNELYGLTRDGNEIFHIKVEIVEEQ